MNITGWPVENSSAFVQKGTKTIMEKKRKSDWILALKMLGNMAIATLISMVVMFVALPVLDKTYGLVLAQIVIALIFIGMIYTPLWYEGDKDRNLVQYDHMKADPLRGLRSGILLMIPFALSNIFLIMAKCGVFFSHAYWALYKIINTYIWPLSNILAPGDQGTPYVIAPDVPWHVIVICACCMLMIPLVSTLAYQFGFHRISLSKKLVYRKK